LESAHFRLRTDQDAAAGRAALTDLEQLQAALLRVFGAPSDLDTGKLPVVVVDRGWTDFAPRAVDGFFTFALFQPLIAMAAGNELHRQDVIKHELVHYLSRKVMPRQPLWLEEGLATYYETIEYDADAGRITVGRPSSLRLPTAQQTGTDTIERMFTATAIDREDTARFYAAAWITVHYLINHREVALRGYQKALAAGASPDAAWAAAFGGQTPAQLAADVRAYVDGGRYAVLIYKFPPPKVAAPVERRLTDADVHATRALLYVTGTGLPEVEGSVRRDDLRLGARREIDEALRQEPHHVRSLAIAHWMLGVPVDLEQATAASSANGDDWLAWLLVAEARGARRDSAGQLEAATRVIEITSHDRSIAIRVVYRTGHHDQ
jgi:hypothetical protein